MKKTLLSLILLSLCSPIACMDSDDELEIIELETERWQEFKALDEQARANYPADDDGQEGSPKKYQTLLTDSLADKERYVVFAQQRKKLIGMAGAALEQNACIATIHCDYATPRLDEVLGHTDMIESLLWKIAQSGITYAQISIPPIQNNVILFYQGLGFTIVYADSSEVVMEKELTKEQ